MTPIVMIIIYCFNQYHKQQQYLLRIQTVHRSIDRVGTVPVGMSQQRAEYIYHNDMYYAVLLFLIVFLCSSKVQVPTEIISPTADDSSTSQSASQSSNTCSNTICYTYNTSRFSRVKIPLFAGRDPPPRRLNDAYSGVPYSFPFTDFSASQLVFKNNWFLDSKSN